MDISKWSLKFRVALESCIRKEIRALIDAGYDIEFPTKSTVMRMSRSACNVLEAVLIQSQRKEEQ